MKVAVDPWAEYSPRKMEIGMEKTTEMTRARKEVARVPTRKGNAPNSLFTGSHVELKRNRIPKFRMAWKGGNDQRKEDGHQEKQDKHSRNGQYFPKGRFRECGFTPAHRLCFSPQAPELRLCCGSFFMSHLFYHEADVFGWKTKPLR